MLSVFRPLTLVVFILLSGCSKVEFPLSDGQAIAFDELENSWVVVNYWAIWCKPCVEEIPELNALNQHDDVVVLGVNYDGKQGEALISQAEKLGINYAMIVNDPSEALQIDRPRALPATVLIDKDGVTREVLYGPQTEASILDKLRLLVTE